MNDPVPHPRTIRSRAWRRWVPIVVLAAAALGAALLVWTTRRMVHHPVLGFRQGDWVLVTRFENRTGERALDGRLAGALERDLQESSYARVVPRRRIDDALRRMNRPLDAPLDGPLGLEVCRRDGGIRALLAGSVERVGYIYTLTVGIVDPASGTAVATFSDEATGEAQVPAAVYRLSRRLRERLGEVLPRGATRPIPDTTTPAQPPQASGSDSPR